MRNLLRFVPLLLCLGAAARADFPKSQKAFFDPLALRIVHLRVSADQWAAMQPTRPASALARIFGGKPATQPAEGVERLGANPFGLEYAYVKGSIEIDGRVFNDVGVRLKGNSSFTMSRQGIKHPFKIDFNRFVDGQDCLGLTMLNLNNNALDPSQLREAMSYHVFREAGLPASRTTFAVLYLSVAGQMDKQCLGFYTIIEEINKDFLKDHFASKKGLLLKPEGMRGLTYFGDDWKRYSKYEPKTDATPELAKRFIDFIKLVNQADDETFNREIASYLEIDYFLRFIAVNSLLANLDSYLTTGHNYYMYLEPKSQKIYWMPWDTNLSFGSFNWVGSGKEQSELSILKPYVAPNRLLDRVLAMPASKAKMQGINKELIEKVYVPDKLHQRIDQFNEVLARAEKVIGADPKTRPTTQPTMRLARDTPDLKQFVVWRVQSVQAQLQGKATGYLPSFQARNIFGFGPGKRGPQFAASILAAYDQDGNGQLSDKEADAAMKRFFESIDSAKTGSIDRKSLTAALEKSVPPPPDGAEPRGPGLPVVLAETIVHKADADKDGRLTLAELSAALQKEFAEADGNKDKFLSDIEINNAVERLLPPRRER